MGLVPHWWRGGHTRIKPALPPPLHAHLLSNGPASAVLCSLVMGELGGGAEGAENEGGAAAQPAGQRITPYMSKVAPQRPSLTPRAHTPTTGGKFAERQNAGAVVASLNAHLELPAASAEGVEAMELDGPAAAANSDAQPRCTVEVLGRPMGPSDKFMVDRLEDKVGEGRGCQEGGWSGCGGGRMAGAAAG